MEPEDIHDRLTDPNVLKFLNATASHHIDEAPKSFKFHIPVPYWIGFDYDDIRFWQPVDASVRIKAAIYMQNRCSTTTLREDYVQELSNHFDVHSFGACMRNRVDSRAQSSPSELVATYLFNIVFEPAYRHITDKMFRCGDCF